MHIRATEFEGAVWEQTMEGMVETFPTPVNRKAVKGIVPVFWPVLGWD